MAATYLDEVTADLPLAASEPDLIAASRLDEMLITVRRWVQSGSAPSWSDCAGLSPELRSWQLQFGNLSIIRKVVCGVAGLRWRQLRSYWCLSVSNRILFCDTMIPFSPVIWVLPDCVLAAGPGLLARSP